MVQQLEFIPLHETFGAECRGVDFSKDLAPEVVDEIKAGLHKHGVLVFRKTGMDDQQYVKFGEWFGEIHRSDRPYGRLNSRELGDPSNIYPDGSIVQKGELQYFIGVATGIFHVDKSYNPRRVRYTTIKCTEPLPPGTGGATEFADTRAAYDDLDEETKKFLEDKVVAHSIFESRRKAAPSLKTFQMLDPKDFSFGRFPIVENQKETGRKDLYLAGHMHHVLNMEEADGKALLEKIFAHAHSPKYFLKIHYDNASDVTIWDNLAVMHRAGGGSYVGKYPRDIRNMTIYDNSEEEWGLNDRSEEAPDAMYHIRKAHKEAFGGENAVAEVKDRVIDWD